jgi:hypothetical protein
VVGIGAVSTSDEAWRWSEGTGVETLGMECPGCFLRRGFATGVSNDGSVIIGFNRGFGGSPASGAGFIWTVETGMVSLNDALIAQGIDTQGFNFSLPLTISGDGLTIGGASAPEDQPFGSNGFVVSLPSRSGPCPGEGSCCIPNGTPGCDDAGCCETICAQDPFCCDIEWDTVCVDQANGLCCDPPPCPGDGCCFAANESPGCDDAACCDAVCAADPFCCDTEWDGLCADGAIAVCFDPPCPGDTNGDSQVNVTDLTNVLLDWGMTGSGLASDVSPNCTIDGGDLTAVILNWGSCDGCGAPAAGDCCQANGTPYCNDAACCNTVCAADPFCCDTEWDGICADGAITACGDRCGP